MGNIMLEGIILKANLKGALKSTGSYLRANNDWSKDEELFDCCVKTVIRANVIKHWQSNECPFWEKPFVWKHMNKKERVKSYINRFDEGYGVSFEEL